MCKVFYFYCQTLKCRESKHMVEEPQYCATIEKSFNAKTLFKKATPKPAWIPTKAMVDTNVEPFTIVFNGYRYVNHNDYTPFDCKAIEWVEQPTVKSCPFNADREMHVPACENITWRHKQEEAEKEERKRKERTKFTYWN